MFSINCRGKLWSFNVPVVMGIINLTPDSFYAASRARQDAELIERAGRMICDGAAILDIGGQSTRPGSPMLSPEEEAARVIPAIRALRKAYPDTLLSVDTYHAHVAKMAADAGVDIINDISGGELDPEMLKTVAQTRLPYICMHMKGTQTNMQNNPWYEDVVREVLDYFIRRSAACREAGIRDLIIDPGFGFGKTIEHNFTLLHALEKFGILDLPILVGVSRKSMIYRFLGSSPEEALNGTTVINTLALMKGAAILRVHDVREAVECIRLTEAVRQSVQ